MIPKTSFALVPFEDGILLEAISSDSLKLQRTDSGLPVAGSNMLYTEYIERKKWAQDVDLYSVAQLNSTIRKGRTKKVIQAVDWESLDSLNLPLLNEHLIALMSGKEALIPEYDMKVSMPADKSHWTPMKLASKEKGIILMEGIHCLNPQLTAAVPRESKFNIAIAPIPALQLDDFHVLSGTSIRMLRRMVRDYLNRGRPVLTTLKQWPAVA